MKKFAVVSGFLGSGKTTTMIALTKYYSSHHGKAAMISNDLGCGVTLADDRFARFSGADASEITGKCICFCHDVLTNRLDSYFNAGCELVVSDIPGFGVGALEHVYHGLTEEYPGKYELGPFTVVIEPESVGLLRGGKNEDVSHIIRAQLMEADLIVLNKCDLLDPQQAKADRDWLCENYPEAKVVTISALTGDGLEELSRALAQGSASLRHPDIDYNGEGLKNTVDRLTEYYLQYHARVCCNDFDGTQYLAGLARTVKDELRTEGYEMPHLKLLAWEPDGDYCKADVTGVNRPTEINRRFERPCTDIAVILNGNAACPAKKLDGIMTNAVNTVSDAYQLELMIFKKVFFNMGER